MRCEANQVVGDLQYDSYELEYANFDRLPAELKQLLRYAPGDYASSGLVLEVRRHGLDAVLGELRRSIAHDMVEATEALYGPDHPGSGLGGMRLVAELVRLVHGPLGSGAIPRRARR